MQFIQKNTYSLCKITLVITSKLMYHKTTVSGTAEKQIKVVILWQKQKSMFIKW